MRTSLKAFNFGIFPVENEVSTSSEAEDSANESSSQINNNVSKNHSAFSPWASLAVSAASIASNVASGDRRAIEKVANESLANAEDEPDDDINVDIEGKNAKA